MSGVVGEALRVAHIDRDAWHTEHQGPLREIVGSVWWCGDEDCDCTQAQIVARFANTYDRRFAVPRTLWQGEFYTDGEPGAAAELAAKRAEIQATEPDLASRIIWQETADV